MFRFQPFSRRQRQLMYWWRKGSPYADYDMVIADGAIRSGKTVAMICGFLMWSQAEFSNQEFILAGKTIGSLKRNVVTPMLRILSEWGWDYSYNRSDNFIRVGTNTYHMFGANAESSQDTLQGMTAAGGLGDEAALFPQSFLDQMVGRCSVDGARVWLNCNPRGPFHYFKVEFIDKAVQKRIAYFQFRMEDNLSLSKKVIARYCRMFSGVFYKRYIEGKWVRAEGVIYDMFDESVHVVPTVERRYTRWFVSCDYGTQNPMVFGLYGLVEDRKDPLNGKWVRVKEYYYDGRAMEKQKTDEDYYRDLEEFVGDLPVEAVIVDPSAASFIVTIRQKGRFVVKKGKNAVLQGIRNTSTALMLGRIVINDCCEYIVKEMHSYVWDEKALERGEDAPLKQEDHCLDEFRYFVNTVLVRTGTTFLT